VPGDALNDWEKGDEKKYTDGRSFEEEWWVADYSNTTEDGYNLTSSIFYVNKDNVQAFLIAIKDIKNETTIGTIPYQLFGLHYYSPEGQEVFIGAIFAFLLGYNNTHEPESGIPNPEHEDVFYIIPFGAAELVDGKNIPEVSRKAEKINDTTYQFTIQYKNITAILTKSPTWSAILKTGWIALFSELTIRYRITLDKENGEVRAETYYDIGQVQELWLIFLGAPISVPVNKIPKTLGIAAVHYVTVFSSYSSVVGAGSGNTIDTGITKPVEEDLSIQGKNNERVFKIGFRGTYDLIDESKNPRETIMANQNAINIILQARFEDTLLVLRQLAFSGDLMSIMAYGISDSVQKEYKSPKDLKDRAIFKFKATPLWYAVAFPEWDGYRIEHDPVYTAYTHFSAPEEESDDKERTVCGSTMVILLATTASVTVVGFKRRKH
jgi:hypothetical protein